MRFPSQQPPQQPERFDLLSLPVLENLRLPSFLQLCISARHLLGLAHLHLYPLPCPQHLALQIETASLLRIVDIEELFEPLQYVLDVGLASLWWFDVENLARLI